METVADRMTRDVLTVTPETSLSEVREIMRRRSIRHLPVVRDGLLVGLVTDRDIRRVWPSDATSLSIWELNYLLDKVKVKEFMTRKVVTTMTHTSLAAAAKVMLDRKISCLPVVEKGSVVGILTQTDLVSVLASLMAA